MKRQHRRWHRLIWSLLVPLLAALMLLLAFAPGPPALLNPALPSALENTADVKVR